MKLVVTLVLGFACLLAAVPGTQAQMTPESQAQPQNHEPSPREVVEQLWSMATQGYLLNRDDARRAFHFFTQPPALSKTRKFKVISNDYWVDRPRFEGATARVDVGYDEIGSIDSALRFTRAPSSGDPCMIKMAIEYELVFAPARWSAYPEWQIKGSPQPPWTTVNTAIRYVLERRRKATDPEIQRNADRTIAVLLRYH